MKRVSTILLAALLAQSAFSLTDVPVTFLGIPVDGTKSAMIDSLKNKGFAYAKTDMEYEFLSGVLNGKDVTLTIHTTMGKVDEVNVFYTNPLSSSRIRIEYNNLLLQLKNNGKYVELEAYEPISSASELRQRIETDPNAYYTAFWVRPQLSVEDYESGVPVSALTGQVWFDIRKFATDRYYISLNYVNLANKSADFGL